MRISSLVCVLSIALGIAATPNPRITAVASKHPKLSAELLEMTGRSHGPAALAAGTVQVVIQTTAEDVSTVRAHVESLGGTFEMSASDLVLARIPISELDALASADTVQTVRRPRAPTTFQTTSEGVGVIGASAWHTAGRKGAGIRVAILDVGFDGYSYLLGSELPNIPDARIRSFSGDISGGGEDHGVGVAEVVHDVAPDAELYLVNFSNEVELENAVNWLIEQQVDVINASWGYPCGGPLDGSGRTNAVVKKAADAGIVWVSAAGNFAQRHWSATFHDPDGDSWHNFTATEEGNTVSMNSGDELRVCVEWDDWTNKDHDLELYVWNSDGNVVASSTENQSGPSTHDPWERLDFTANGTGEYYIGVKRYSGTRNPQLHLYAYPPGDECAIEGAARSAESPKSIAGELRQFRDVVLAPSPAGRTWIESYYRHSREVRRILLLHPRLAIEAAALLNASRPAVRSVIAARSGQPGDPFVFSPDYVARVDRFLEELGSMGSPTLREDLSEFRTRAAFPAAAEQTADRYWDALLEDSAYSSRPAGQAFPDSGYMRYTSAETSLVPPADSQHAFTVGAVQWSTGVLEEFSSRGPTADGRRKPDLVAPDGVCTTTYADCGSDGFRGTSAAAPHATGAMALVLQAYPALSLSAVRSFLTGRAVDIAPAGPDNQTGAGRLAMGSTTVSDALPAPTLLHPIGSAAPLWPTVHWSEVSGATSYRVMIATTSSALPTDPLAQTCSGSCLVNTTTDETFVTPSAPLLATTTYHWQVQALGTGKHGLWARASFTTTVPPEQTQPERTELAEALGNWKTTAGKATVITHGWRANAGDWPRTVAGKICQKFGESKLTDPIKADTLTKLCQANGWDIWVLDWQGKSGLRSGLPERVFNNAVPIGEKLATHLKSKDYTHVHFIAHSAGSNLIHNATVRLREKQPAIQIHETFLDAYEPALDATRYGSDATWADNYVDTRNVFSDSRDGTRLFLTNAYNVNVTPPENENEDCGWPCRHSRPYRFYSGSIDFGFDDEGGEDPISGAGGMGYPLSTESGRTLASLKETHRINESCRMNGDSCTTEDATASRPTFSAVPVTRGVQASSGVVTYVFSPTSIFSSVRLGSLSSSGVSIPSVGPAATPTEAPSWIVVDATTTEPVNQLRFQWRFRTAGEGLLRVFVDGMLVRELDQRYVPGTSTDAEEVYIGGAAGALAPGMHRIVFRLDGYAASASGVELTSVEIGMVEPGTRRRVVRH